MIFQIAKHVYKAVRKAGGLTVDDVAVAIKRQKQTVYRAEAGLQLLTPEQERILHQKANVSTEAFGEMLCAAATEVLGRRVRLSATRTYLPTMPLARAAALYSTHHERLDRPAREKIEAKLRHGRMLDAVADAMSSHLEKEIRDLIEDALGPE